MKVGFIVNLVLLMCFMSSQILIWLVDGTLVLTLNSVLSVRSATVDPYRSQSSIKHARR